MGPDSDDEEDGEDESTGTEAEEIEQGQLDSTTLEDSNLEESALEESALADESEVVGEESGNELEERVEQRDEKESEEMKRKIARNGSGAEGTTQQAGTVEANRSQASTLDDHTSQWIHTFTKPQALRLKTFMCCPMLFNTVLYSPKLFKGD